jgi:glutamate synthase domain-containing protein 1/glutamate synthase domain-containing protein 3
VNETLIKYILEYRKRLAGEFEFAGNVRKTEEEGGCGVVGFCCSEPVAGRHIYEPSKQMHNRGNGKGGGIAAVGLVPEQLGVSRKLLDEYYMLHIALLDPKVRPEMEKKFIEPNFEVAFSCELDKVKDWKTIKGLEVKPPDVWRYFVRVKPDVLDSFIAKNNLKDLERVDAEDEFINQNSFKLNQTYYASLGEQRAFVLSHGKNIMILKVVGYAEAIVQYYKIEDLCAHIWIAHQRYPTKGRVWHPGGAHPFAAINMALVHNGDFANYHSVSEHLKQRHIYPQFLTDTEVSALLFDLLDRTYRYPLEYIIEAMAPTTEHDFDCLPEKKKSIYRNIQATHIHGSPDGPWFFIIARNVIRENKLQLMGITDTAMLRPQVFAFLDGEVQVGLIGSEKQAIDATLHSLSKQDNRICPVADRYWNARGGSHTDGGSFIFNLEKNTEGKIRIACTNKFGVPPYIQKETESCDFNEKPSLTKDLTGIEADIDKWLENGEASALFEFVRDNIHRWTFGDIRYVCGMIAQKATNSVKITAAIEALTLLNDRKYSMGTRKKSHVIFIIRESLHQLFGNIPKLDTEGGSEIEYRLIDFNTRNTLRSPQKNEKFLVIDASLFPPEGNDCDATLLVDAYRKGWKHFLCYNCRGQRFIGCGLGPETDDVTIDVYDSSGDYLGSGIDGLTITVHGNAQDQLGQIIKRGKMVIYGDVGQTFMYGAKGGSVFVLGNAAGRPMINSVGRPKVVINGTCLDFLAESFMAGDPLTGGGFAIVNGVEFDDDGNIISKREPYPGSNLFSLASGGAIYIRDSHHNLTEQQLNGGEFAELTQQDWDVILPYLDENERLFGISVDELLTVDGHKKMPEQVYRKVCPIKIKPLATAAPKEIKEEILVAQDTESENEEY